MTGPRWRWKLWHLSALVAVVAVIMALAVRFPLLLAGILLLGVFIGVLGIFLVPPYLIATVWDRYLNRSHKLSQPPTSRLEAVYNRAFWFILILFLHVFVVGFVLSLFGPLD